jgi:hypothetical protein
MNMKKLQYLCACLLVVFCVSNAVSQDTTSEDYVSKRVDIYKSVKLTADISSLEENERNVLIMLIEAARLMDEIFWMESYGDKSALMEKLPSESHRKFAEINYGPWDRLNGNKSFVEGIGPKPAGANFYPADMTQKEFDNLKDSTKNSQYTVLKRDKDGNLISVPYSKAFLPFTMMASQMLMQASEMCESDTILGNFLRARALAIMEDDYDPSDRLWLDMKDNKFDIIIGPIENYEDHLYGLKTAHEAYVLIKDMEWSKKLAKYVTYLPELQKNLPVEQKYKMETPGSSSQLGAYDVVYYAGDCNSGSKTIAVNLPNDETLQKEKGTRRSQLKNAMKAKFDEILLPLSEVLIDEEQRKHVTFESFFENTMFHEVAHGLGIKETINGKGTVRQALGPLYSALEEGKADVLGLFMITQLHDKGVLTEHELMDNYVTFMASIFRSVRFGASSAHGKANMIRFNYFKEQGAFTKDKKKGTYKIDFEKMKAAVNSLSNIILTLQGDGDLEGVQKLVAEKGIIGKTLQADLDKLTEMGIPVDIVFEQGVEVLGL